MKTKYILSSFCLLLFFSCKKQLKDPYADYPELILGEWIILGDNIYHLNEEGFYFKSNDTCEIRPGYLDSWFTLTPQKFYGNKTTYQIRKDTLSLFDLQENCWKGYKLRFQAPDTMNIEFGLYEYNRMPVQYVRAHYPVNDKAFFDQVIVLEVIFLL